MQSTGRKCLNRDRKGVLDLPIRLLVVMILLTISLPIIANAVDMNEDSMMMSEMEQESGKLFDAVRMAHFSGIGSSRCVNISLPAGCEIKLGGSGSDAFAVHTLYEGKELNTKYLESPAIRFSDEMTLTGECSLIITSIESDIPTVEVFLS